MHTESIANTRGPAEPVRRIVDAIDTISGFFGKSISFLLIPMVFCLLYEVVGRYFFTAPTIWAGDMATIMYGMLFMIASSYCLREGGHIRTDFLYNRWSERTQGGVDFLIYLFVFLPVHLVFLKVSWDFFLKSYQLGERIISSPWMPIIWPLKFAIPLGIFLITLQGIAETIKSFYAWRYGKFFWERHAHGSESGQEDLASCPVK